MPQTQTRVVGSGFTTFNFNGNPIAWLDNVLDHGQLPFTPPQTVTPLGSRYAKEVVTGRVLSPGTITCTIREAWNEPAWQQLSGLAGTNDIVQVFERMASLGVITCQTIIKPVGSQQFRGQIYHNCTITEIDDSEAIAVGTLNIQKTVTILYTNKEPLSTTGQPVF